MSTISGTTITTGITLSTSGNYASPLTITASGAVKATAGNAIYGPAAQAWTVANSGTILGTAGAGIDLTAGGNVGNLGTAGLIEGYRGVYITGATGTLTNYGTVAATGTAGRAIFFSDGGNVTNGVSGAPLGPLIEGAYAVESSGSAATVANLGTIAGTKIGVFLAAGGGVTNGVSGAPLGALIEGAYAVEISGTTGTLANLGTVAAANVGVFLVAGGGVTNGDPGAPAASVIKGTGTFAVGVLIEGGGFVINDRTGAAAGATIEGSRYGVWLYGGAGTVTNSGTISGTGTAGLAAGVLLGAGGTVINSGTISGGNGTAIGFGGTAGNLLVLDPGYRLAGKVVGSGSVGATNTLELGSIASAGTLSAALATEFVNFGTVTVDPGADWTLTGASFLSGITLTDLGTLTNAGTLAGAGSLIVDPASLVNTGSIGLSVTLSGGGTLDNEAGGTIAVAGTAVFGTGNAATILNRGTIAATGTAGIGIDLDAGGSVTNGASGSTGGLIDGNAYGVYVNNGAGTVINFGTIIGAGTAGSSFGFGVRLLGGGSVTNLGTIEGFGTNAFGINIVAGSVTNGQSGSTGGLISGPNKAVSIYSGGTVINFGTIAGAGPGAFAVLSDGGGRLSNYGMIGGTASFGIGVLMTRLISTVAATGTVSNYGTIAEPGIGGIAVELSAGATVTNAGSGLISATADAVRISGAGGTLVNLGTIMATGEAVSISSAGGTVVNMGTITATGTTGIGVRLDAGGSVTNGASGSTSALIEANAYGVYIDSATGTVINFGTIIGAGTAGSSFGFGVRLLGGGSVTNLGTIEGLGTNAFGINIVAGSVTNGQSGSTGGLISGPNKAVSIYGAVSTVTNFGTITGVGPEALAVLLDGGGRLTNYGMIGGTGLFGRGVYASNLYTTIGATGTVANFGTIADDYAIVLGVNAGAGVTNGASGAPGGLIEGRIFGVWISGVAGSVANFGTIESTGGFSPDAGVYLAKGGIVTNEASGLIEGAQGAEFGSTSLSSSGTVTNFGRIEGSLGFGVYLRAGGTVVNSAGGLITGPADGAKISQNGGAVFNYGTILGTGTNSAGVLLSAGGDVTNKASGVISGSLDGIEISSAGLVVNFGNILATGTNGTGIALSSGSVVNFGTVVAGTDGTGIYLNSGNVTNYGTIIAPTAAAVIVRHGTFINKGVVKGSVYGIELGLTGSGTGTGMVTVSGTGTVTGTVGIGATSGITAGYTVTVGGTVMSTVGSAGTAVNLGGLTGRLIVDPGAAFTGMLVGGGGSSVLEIAASGSGSGGSGGAVGADGATAYVSLGSVVNFSLLQIDPSATVSASGVLSIPTLINQGQVNIGSGDDFAFAAVSAASTGVIDLRTGGIVAFSGAVYNQDLYFHPPGGTALIEKAGEFGATITGFTVGDTIDLTGFAAASRTFANNALVLTDTVSNHVTLDIQGSFTTGNFALASDGASGTDITAVACFLRGTRVMTEAGEVAVEDLAIGDHVVTLSGAARPVKWIGRRSYGGRFVAGNPAALPIRITAGALAEGIPARDLWLSPEHALLLDGMLVPAGLLANGATITQITEPERVEYFHIEIETHDVILAEGTAAETYVDCDNRLMFQNAGEFARLYPDARPAPWQFCAPRVEPGSPGLTAIRAALLARAERFGHRLDLDPDPDLHLIVDGRTIWPDSIAGERHRFRLPAGARAVWLTSRSAVPAEVETAGSRDRRRLGVPLARIALFDAERSIEAGHGDAALCVGFHEDEGSQRWTNGRARLPDAWLHAFPGGAVLDVHLVPTGLAYRLPPPALAEAAA